MERGCVDLVLEGGGVKGIGHVGAVTRLMADFDVVRVAGSSAGAIVGAMIAAGGSAEDLRSELFDFPFPRVPHRDVLDRVPIVGPALSVAFERGVYETTFLRDYISDRLTSRGVHVFGDLRHDDGESSLPRDHRYKLVVTATDLTTGELLYLPWDYERFGLDPDEQPVADAVVASAAIPLYFEPVRLQNARTGVDHILVDGGTLSNYPITVFDRIDGRPPRWPTFGLKLIPRLPEGAKGTLPLIGRIPLPGIEQLEALVATLIVGRDQTFLSRPCVAARTIQIDTEGVNAIDFSVNDAQKRLLFDQGWAAADAFLTTWDWDAYLTQCAGGRTGVS
jgi:NTE family protein